MKYIMFEKFHWQFKEHKYNLNLGLDILLLSLIQQNIYIPPDSLKFQHERGHNFWISKDNKISLFVPHVTQLPGISYSPEWCKIGILEQEEN